MWEQRLKRLRVLLFVVLGFFAILGAIWGWFAHGPTGIGRLDKIQAELDAQMSQLEESEQPEPPPPGPPSTVVEDDPTTETSIKDRIDDLYLRVPHSDTGI